MMLNDFFAQYCLSTVIGCGILALALFVGSTISARKMKYLKGLIFAFLELASAGMSTSAWMWALESSGKPTFLFGFTYFWPMSLICICMFVVGTICLAVNAWGLARQALAYEEAAKA